MFDRLLERQRAVTTELHCVFDQAIYSKTMGLKCGYSDKYKDYCDSWHLSYDNDVLRNYGQKSFRCRFKRTYCTKQNDVVASGSVHKDMRGKMYSRLVRAHLINCLWSSLQMSIL